MSRYAPASTASDSASAGAARSSASYYSRLLFKMQGEICKICHLIFRSRINCQQESWFPREMLKKEGIWYEKNIFQPAGCYAGAASGRPGGESLSSQGLWWQGSNFRLGGIAPITRVVPSFRVSRQVFEAVRRVWSRTAGTGRKGQGRPAGSRYLRTEEERLWQLFCNYP